MLEGWGRTACVWRHPRAASAARRHAAPACTHENPHHCQSLVWSPRQGNRCDVLAPRAFSPAMSADQAMSCSRSSTPTQSQICTAAHTRALQTTRTTSRNGKAKMRVPSGRVLGLAKVRDDVAGGPEGEVDGGGRCAYNIDPYQAAGQDALPGGYAEGARPQRPPRQQRFHLRNGTHVWRALCPVLVCPVRTDTATQGLSEPCHARSRLCGISHCAF